MAVARKKRWGNGRRINARKTWIEVEMEEDRGCGLDSKEHLREINVVRIGRMVTYGGRAEADMHRMWSKRVRLHGRRQPESWPIGRYQRS